MPKIIVASLLLPFVLAGFVAAGEPQGKDFKGKDLQKRDMSDQNLEQANFEDANLFLTVFKRCKMAGAVFKDADLTSTSFGEADLTGADFRDAKIDKTFFQGANLSQANFEGQNLKTATLQNAKLKGANLRNLKGISDITKADFREADLRGANLLDAVDYAGTTANFKRAKYDKETRWPKGFDVENSGAVLVESEEKEKPAAAPPAAAPPAAPSAPKMPAPPQEEKEAEGTQESPRLGKYEVIRSTPGGQSKVTYFELLPDGKYKQFNVVDDKLLGEGEYSFDAKTHSVKWLSGPHKEVGYGGTFAVEGEKHIIKMSRSSVAVNEKK